MSCFSIAECEHECPLYAQKEHNDGRKIGWLRMSEHQSCSAEAGLEDDVQEEALPTPLEDVFDESDDEMAGFIDDDDPGRRAGRRRARGLPRGVSSHGLQVAPAQHGIARVFMLQPNCLLLVILLLFAFMLLLPLHCRRCKTSLEMWMSC